MENNTDQFGNNYSYKSPRKIIFFLLAMLLTSLVFIIYTFFDVFRTPKSSQAKSFKEPVKQTYPTISPEEVGDSEEKDKEEPTSDTDLTNLDGEIENIEERLNQLE
jgi:hypothetical protein